MRTLFAIAATVSLNLSALAANGDLDPSFGTSGLGRTGLTNSIFAGAIPPVIQPDGRILICSTQATGGSTGLDFLVARFTADGILDPTFSFDGKVAIDFDGGTGGGDYCTGIALQTDGKIVVAGFTSTNATIGLDFAVARLNADGTLDTANFGAGTGKKLIGFDLGGTNDDLPNSLAIQTDGKIVAAGYATTTSNGQDFAVVRLNTDGSRDAGFNLTGKVTVGFNLAGSTNKDDVAHSVALDAAGNIVLGGTANKASSNYDFAVARLLPNGLPDANFDADGRATLAFDLGGAGGSNDDEVLAMKIQRDGKIVLGGYADTSSTLTIN
jgi:uncharacterized delta-60 repeat protein